MFSAVSASLRCAENVSGCTRDEILIHLQKYLLPHQDPSFNHNHYQYTGIFYWQLMTVLESLFVDMAMYLHSNLDHQSLLSNLYTCTSDGK